MQKFDQQLQPHPEEDVEAHMGTPLEPGDCTSPQAAMTPVLNADEDVETHRLLP